MQLQSLSIIGKCQGVFVSLAGDRRKQERLRHRTQGPRAAHHRSLRPLHARHRPLHERLHESGAVRLRMAG